MNNVPSHLRYTESHEWVSTDGNGKARIGISDHAQGALGEMVFVELPIIGDDIRKGDACGVIESVKAASEVYAPASGKVTEINEELESDPSVINDDPYGEGWLFGLELTNDKELVGLKDAETYEASLKE